MITLALSAAALLVALAALVLAVLVARQSAALSVTLDRHRHGHLLRDGAADPQTARSHRPDRRQVNLGPSRTAGERRERPAEPLSEPPGSDGPPTAPQAASGSEEPQTAHLRRQLPRPGQIGQR